MSELNITIGRGNKNHYSEFSKALIKFCIQDGDNASNEISERLANIQNLIECARNQLSEGQDQASMEQTLSNMSNEVIETVMSLQFFDRISQRMTHAVDGIEAINEPGTLKSRTIQDRFTMDDERILFSALQEGCSVEDALIKANAQLDHTIESKGSDIELF